MSKRPRQPWKVVPSDASDRQFRALTYEQKQGVFDALRPVLESANPAHAPGVIKLKDVYPDTYRVRARDHRVLFRIINKPSKETPQRWKGEIHILSIKARKDAY